MFALEVTLSFEAYQFFDEGLGKVKRLLADKFTPEAAAFVGFLSTGWDVCYRSYSRQDIRDDFDDAIRMVSVKRTGIVPEMVYKISRETQGLKRIPVVGCRLKRNWRGRGLVSLHATYFSV